MNEPMSSETRLREAPSGAKGISKLFIIIVAGIFGIVGLGIGGYFLFITVFLSPEKIFLNMIEKSKSIKTIEFTSESRAELMGFEPTLIPSFGNLGGAVPPAAEEKKEEQKNIFIVNMAGVSDTTNPEKINGKVTINIALDETAKQPELQKGNAPVLNTLLGWETRFKDNVLYVSMKNTPNLGIFDLSSLENQWIKLSSIDEETKKAAENIFPKHPEISKEKEKQLLDVFMKEKYFEIKKGAEKMDDVATHHLIFILTRDGVKKYIDRVSSILSEEEFKKEDREMVNSVIETVIPQDKPLQFDVWVGKKDFYPRQFRFHIDVLKTEGSSVSGNISMSMTLENINKPVTIEIPENTKTIDEVIGSLFGGGLGGGELSVELKDSDGDGLSDADEGYYGTNINMLDTDGDTYNDGDEVKNGYNPNGPGKLTVPPPPSAHPISSSIEFERSKSRDTKRITDIKALQANLEIFTATTGGYPIEKEQKVIEGLWLCGDDREHAFRKECRGGGEKDWQYVQVPQNPSPGGTPYQYRGLPDGSSYRINFSLEEDTPFGFVKGCNVADEKEIHPKNNSDPPC